MNPNGPLTSPQPVPENEAFAQVARFAVAQDAGGHLLTDWIEQFQDFHRIAAADGPRREWDEVFQPAFSPARVRRDMEELGRRISHLAERIQALERR